MDFFFGILGFSIAAIPEPEAPRIYIMQFRGPLDTLNN